MWRIIERPDLKHPQAYIISYHLLWNMMVEFLRANERVVMFTVVRRDTYWTLSDEHGTIIWKAEEL